MADGGDGSGDRGDVEIVTPPHTLKKKVSGSGGPTPEMLARAEAAIAKMSDDYPEWAGKDVEKLSALVETLSPEQATNTGAARDAFRLAHDMRGQGGSFGYPLMTRIANSFCRFMEKMETLDAGAIDILSTHVDAMRAVIGHKVSGDGGETGRQIAEGLEQATRKYLTRHGLS
ncbi:Hpt domain-containing protein [Marivibrio halodurans]|uniref:Hpt domain-containing protein n=1 Tax=Marivibrio halodurans TaxID=2039722 RepID=A0A8J7S6J3_9PROT|nr:Hpt domain-containing protein [Marivibrio halodurans]MBP5857694.1 Hpt domain-containing protein [Marivibrio halodurans]